MLSQVNSGPFFKLVPQNVPNLNYSFIWMRITYPMTTSISDYFINYWKVNAQRFPVVQDGKEILGCSS
jgi:hypothetical protein